MYYIFIGLILLVMLAAAFAKFGRPDDDTHRGDRRLFVPDEAQPAIPAEVAERPVLPIEQITLSDSDAGRLAEIKDNKVLSEINRVIPAFTQAGVAINNAAQALEASKRVLYKIEIPPGKELVMSKEVKGAFRGFYRGKDGRIEGHANIMKAENKNGRLIAPNVASALMSMGSMVVGQYYMGQIDKELRIIDDRISKISAFLETGYHSNVLSLIIGVRGIIDCQSEILENEELRMANIAKLENELEPRCKELLGQATVQVGRDTEMPPKNYDEYKESVSEKQKWYIYREALMDILSKISELKYALYFGKVSREYCSSALPGYIGRFTEAVKSLAEWHGRAIKKLDIDIEKSRVRKDNFLDEVISFIPGLFDDNLNYNRIDEKTLDMIVNQSTDYSGEFYDASNYYSEYVQLVTDGEKVYYLPPEKQADVTQKRACGEEA